MFLKLRTRSAAWLCGSGLPEICQDLVLLDFLGMLSYAVCIGDCTSAVPESPLWQHRGFFVLTTTLPGAV